MKVVITGGAGGIGKALVEKFTSHDHEVISYDIVEGNDVTNPVIANKLMNECKDADIFINNVLQNQISLLESIHTLWKNKHKTIVNISSAVTYMYGPNNYPEGFVHYYEYKHQLNEMIKKMQYQNLSPHILNVRPSWVDTQASKSFEGIKMRPEVLADLIYKIVEDTKPYQILDIVVR